MTVGAVGSGVEVRFDAEDVAVGLGGEGRGGDRALPGAVRRRFGQFGAGFLALRADSGLLIAVLIESVLIAIRRRLGVGARRQIAFPPRADH